MADVHTPEQRHRNMAAIRSRDTKPEVYLRHLLFARGFRYRIAPSGIPGHPDMYMAKYNAAIFVHGCFWHRHANCRYATTPASNMAFWQQKFAANTERDTRTIRSLQDMGIRCLVVWECTIRQMMRDEAKRISTLNAVRDFLLSNTSYLEL